MVTQPNLSEVKIEVIIENSGRRGKITHTISNKSEYIINSASVQWILELTLRIKTVT